MISRCSFLAALLVCVVALPCAAGQESTQAFSVPFKELQSYKKSGVMWRNIVVDKKIKRDDLIKLAQELHAAFPKTPFRIFTDDARFAEYMQRDIHYPDPAYTYPAEWAKKHYIAMINEMMDGGRMRWQVYPMGLAGMKFVAKGDSVIANLN